MSDNESNKPYVPTIALCHVMQMAQFHQVRVRHHCYNQFASPFA